MREALKTNISKYGPKTNTAMTVENVQGKGLQLVVVYAGKKHYLSLSSVPLNPDEHANHPNHQKIKVDHNGHIGIGTTSPEAKLDVRGNSGTIVSGGVTYDNIALLREDGGEGIYISSNSSSHDVMIQPTYTEGDLIFGRRTGVEPANFEGLKIEAGGNVGINDNSPDNQLHVTNASGVQKAVVKLEQLDNNEPFFRFQGTSASDGSRSISSDTAKSSDKAGAIMVNINGNDRWIWFYDNYGPSSP